MEIDHIFVFCNDSGKPADFLVERGFTEGSSRIHKGQGTANRKFYFENFFLEILWVHSEEEISMAIFKEIGLWQRSKFESNGTSRFGLCLINSAETDKYFTDVILYQPDYFPAGMPIEIANRSSVLPWTFRLPFKGVVSNPNEPKYHQNGAKLLTNVIFEVVATELLLNFKDSDNPQALISDRNWLTLEFDNYEQNKIIEIPELNLTIKM